MKKSIWIFSCALFALLLLAAIQFTFPPVVLTVSASETETPTSSVCETSVPQIDGSVDPMGWLSLQATAPLGFEGIICIELRNRDTNLLETVLLDALTEYSGGSWLPSGAYTVERTYVPGSDHFSVESHETEVVVTHEGDAALALTVIADMQFDAELEDIRSSFIPNPPTEPLESAGQAETSTAPSSIPTTVSDIREVDEGNSNAVGLAFIGFLATAIVIGIVLSVIHFGKSHYK